MEEKNMKLEDVNTRTKEAVDFLVAALETGHSEILTAYLGAMAKFHSYSSATSCSSHARKL
jgi:DNA-binding phage protein